MSRRRLGWVVLLAVVVGQDPASARAQGKQPIRWGADAEGGAPFIFAHPSRPGRNIGFEVDIARALEKELGRTFQFIQYDFKNLIPGLERGDFDLSLNGLEITPDREKRVRFTKPYYAFKLQLVVRANDDRFTSLEGVKNHRGMVGTLEDTAASRLLEKRRVRMRIYDGQVEPYQDLDQRELDAVLLDRPIALYYAQKSRVTPRQPDLKFVGHIAGRGYYAIACRKDNQELVGALDSALDRLLIKGTLRRIYEKWSIWNAEQEELVRDLLWEPRAAALCANIPFAGPLFAATALVAEAQAQPPPGEFQEDDEQDGGDADDDGFFTLLLHGAKVTIFVTVLSFLLAMALGLPIALARLYGPAPLRWLATVYVEFFRGIPVLLLLAFLYYGLPAIAQAYHLEEYGITLKMNALLAAVIGFGLNYAAYEAEIYRAGIGSIPVGQWEAAASLGMSGPLTFRRIILPQAIRVILPPMTNDLVALFKDTSVVSIIAVVELSKQYLILTKSGSENLVTISLATAALYLVMSVPLGYFSRYLERRWGGRDK